MGGGKRKQHTPYEAPDGLKSTQLLSVIDALSEGPIEGPVNGLQSVLINGTPVVDAEGKANIHGVKAQWRAGEHPQVPMDGFEAAGNEVSVGARIEHGKPVMRTITAREIDRLRVTLGVPSLVQVTDKGDQIGTRVELQIQWQQGDAWVTQKQVIIDEKSRSPYQVSVVLDTLPPRPFHVRVVRVTPDSSKSTLQNETHWSSYTEIVDIRQGYPNTAVAGVQVEAAQFGQQQVNINYHARGRIVRIPVNYDPLKRTYTGLWDGTFKPGWTNNPAWCVLDLLTHPRYGLGQRLGVADVDIWALYSIARYCDQPVPDGFGGTEPRMTCNAYLTTRRRAYDVLADFCSIMRCMPVWNGQVMTFIQDKPADSVWPYTKANVISDDEGVAFRYSFSALKARHNAVEVRFVDPLNGWQVSTELVEDTDAIAKWGRNLLTLDGFGCTSRGQAHRMGLWIIETEQRETQTVDFTVGAEGLRHTVGDIVEILDNYISY